MPIVITVTKGRGEEDGEDATLLASADFQFGNYSVAGTAVNDDDVVDDISGIVGGDGLVIPESTINSAVRFIGDFANVLLGMEWTIVIKFDRVATDAMLFSINHEPNTAADVDPFMAYEDTGGNELTVDDNVDVFRQVFDADAIADGLHRIAVTRTAAKLAMSKDGDFVITDAIASDPGAPTIALLGGTWEDGDRYSWGAVNIHRIDVYTPKTDFEMQQLSSL